MACVCAAVLRVGSQVEVPVFVLSCRVLGYGIEKAVLNSIKRLARRGPGGVVRPVVGHFRETEHNEPCRRMYPDNQFIWSAPFWVCAYPIPGEDAPWLSVCEVQASPVQ
jgi:predicted enzyme involved in methoxymalonyl-ACP biosynthesis